MTRRIIKPQPDVFLIDGKLAPVQLIHTEGDPFPRIAIGRVITRQEVRYAVGDHLWVRETWRTESRAYDDLAPADMDADYSALYEVDADWSLNKTVGRLRQAIHMPRWASRLTLKVVAVKVERLQKISEEEAKAEGVELTETTTHGQCWHASYRAAFSSLWNTIHGPAAWEADPWVVAISFEVIKKNIDSLLEIANRPEGA